MVDLSSLNFSQLVELKKQIDVEIVNRKEAEKGNLRAEMQRMAAAVGLTIDEVMEVSKKNRKSASAGVPMYRNPADGSQTWTGRGRKPQWAMDWIAQHGSLDGLHI